jgi:peptide/nickel transport system permease protein
MIPLRLFGHRLSVLALIGFIIIAINVFAAVFAPWVAPHNPAAVIGEVWGLPSGSSLLGYDNLGRDVLSRMIHGARVTIGAAFAASIFAYLIGCLLGIFAALAGGWVDLVISRVADVMLAIPTLIFALALLTVFQGTAALIVTIGLLMSTRVFRFARALALDIVAMDFIEAARLRGESTAWIVLREILPNAVSGLAAEFGLRICFAVLFISSLSFLGFGVQPPAADWGRMVRENAVVIGFGGWAPLYPAAAIALLAVGVNLVVDWLVSTRTRKTEAIQ